jgi:hypothetical protein
MVSRCCRDAGRALPFDACDENGGGQNLGIQTRIKPCTSCASATKTPFVSSSKHKRSNLSGQATNFEIGAKLSYLLSFQASAFISIWRAFQSSCGYSTTVMVQMHATRNVLWRFYAPSVANAWVKVVFVLRHNCNCCTTSRKSMSQRFAKDKNTMQGLSVWIRVHYFVPFMLSFSFSSTRGPEISPQNTGDKRQMNHDAEYDNVGISDACFVKGSFTRR